MKGIVDRFEGDFVIIEIDGVTNDIAKSDVEDNVRAGDSVILVGGIWITDQEGTKSRTKEIGDLMDSVWED